MPEIDAYLKDSFQFLNATHGEDEKLVYRFRGGGTREISGIVNRSPAASYGPGGEIVQPLMTITIQHDSTLGVLQSEIDKNDKIDVEVIPGNGKVTRLVSRVHNAEAGTILIEVN